MKRRRAGIESWLQSNFSPIYYCCATVLNRAYQGTLCPCVCLRTHSAESLGDFVPSGFFGGLDQERNADGRPFSAIVADSPRCVLIFSGFLPILAGFHRLYFTPTDAALPILRLRIFSGCVRYKQRGKYPTFAQGLSPKRLHRKSTKHAPKH